MKMEAKYRCYTKAICNIGVTTILAKFYKIIRKVIGLLGTYFENQKSKVKSVNAATRTGCG